jgi:2-amino-4-hydroxy-6-hydroxymethyldihydropteridine diphosphokinase
VTVAFIGVGANLDDPRAHVTRAMDELDRLPHSRVVKRSSLYRSQPVGYAPQPDFVNAVAQLETGLPAERLLGELQGIEAAHGRQRSFPNAPRTLDLDVLLYGELRLRTSILEIPHPRMHERAFVLKPLAEIAPGIVIPDKGPAAELLESCKDQGVDLLG